jgi:hypothetical protein
MIDWWTDHESDVDFFNDAERLCPKIKEAFDKFYENKDKVCANSVDEIISD